jgi:hypothetical protein
MVFNRPARAIVDRDDVPDSQYTALSASSQYSGAGYVDILGPGVGEFGSATLIAPDWVLTAAHAVTVNEMGPAFPATYVTFGQGASTTPFQVAPNAISQIFVDPNYNGDTTQGSDLALLQLATPITNVTPAVLYPFAAGTELGLTTTVVGYGYTGTGLTGYQSGLGLGTRRAGTNIIDAFGGQTTTGGPGGNSSYDFSSFSSDVMMTDFDDPNNPSASLMGGTTPTPMEGSTAPGDSGGGAYVTINGQTYITGVTSFLGSTSDNTYSTAPDAHYGDFDGFTRLSVPDSQSFLDSILMTTSAWNLAGGGTWASQGSWTGSNIPGFMGATANFGSAITTPSTVTLDGNWTAGTVTFNNTNSYTLCAGNGGSLTLDNGGAMATASVIDNCGCHFITAPIYLNSNVLFNVVNAGNVLTISGPFSGNGGVTVAGSGTLRLAPGGGMTTLSALTVQTGATLDITNNTIGINYGAPGNSPVAAIEAALAHGYSGGNWTGTGINSSTAAAGTIGQVLSVGYADGNVDIGTPAAANQVLIKFTLAGDALLNGTVNFNDLDIVGQHLNTTGNDWVQGNFNYDPNGVVNFNDLDIIAQNLNKSLNDSSDSLGGTIMPLGQSASLAISNSIALPEPSALALVMCAATLAARRRRRASAKTGSGDNPAE